VKNRLELALRYNDLAVLENFHASQAWAVLTAPEHNLLAAVDLQEATQVRDVMLAMILGTDMSGHFDELAKFKARTLSGSFAETSPENTRAILKMALHCADVSNPAKAADLCVPWSIRVMDEFFMQGDKEKEAGLPVSPFMDRGTTVVSKCWLHQHHRHAALRGVAGVCAGRARRPARGRQLQAQRRGMGERGRRAHRRVACTPQPHTRALHANGQRLVRRCRLPAASRARRGALPPRGRRGLPRRPVCAERLPSRLTRRHLTAPDTLMQLVTCNPNCHGLGGVPMITNCLPPYIVCIPHAGHGSNSSRPLRRR
jgi:hypothetical protein